MSTPVQSTAAYEQAAAKIDQQMVPVHLRFTRSQMDRINAQRDKDGLPAREHIRRALDLYLDALDGRAYGVTPLPPMQATQPSGNQAQEPPASETSEIPGTGKPAAAPVKTAPRPAGKRRLAYR